MELAKINRWAVTGTPLSSSFDDLVPQLYFLELEPFMTVKPRDGIWEGLLDDAINHHRPPAIVALTNLVRLVMWRNRRALRRNQLQRATRHRRDGTRWRGTHWFIFSQ